MGESKFIAISFYSNFFAILSFSEIFLLFFEILIKWKEGPINDLINNNFFHLKIKNRGFFILYY